MTIYNQFTNLNMDYFSNGINGADSWFSPVLPCTGWSVPSFNFNFPDFSSLFNFSSFQMPAFQMPSFDFSNIFSTNIWETGNNSSIWNNNSFQFNNTNFSAVDSFTLTNKNKANLSDINYDANAGEKLAKTALQGSVGWTGYCARYVKKAIAKAGLGDYTSGHAYQMPKIMASNKNFKEISTSKIDVKDLPAGCVLVYNRGSQGYSSEYGHTEITTGDGRAVSDGITKHLFKKPDAIFVPVTA